jgi:hypothetical protein
MTFSFYPCVSFLWGSYDIFFGTMRLVPVPLPLNFVRRLFGNLHVRYYTRACACPLYVPSYTYISLTALLLHSDLERDLDSVTKIMPSLHLSRISEQKTF